MSIISASVEKAEECLKDDEKHMASGDYYWNSYAHFGIHEEMLKDEVRTRSYRNSILNNKHLYRDKIVMDVGCGTGIMSLFAVTAGAKHVYAIDNSAIIEQAKQIAIDNGVADRITFIRGKVEEIELPEGAPEKVDVIISEWMGYFLFYESMLDTLIFARDKWLVPGGALMPDRASLNICAIEDQDYKEEKINWWDRVWGYNMSCIRKLAMLEPLVDTVDNNAVCTDHCEMLVVDLNTVKKEELAFKVPFTLKAAKNENIHAFVAFFDIWFAACHKSIHFSTGPHARYTHWKQTVFYLEEPLLVAVGDEIKGTLSCKPNIKNPRDLDIVITYRLASDDAPEIRQEFFLR